MLFSMHADILQVLCIVFAHVLAYRPLYTWTIKSTLAVRKI